MKKVLMHHKTRQVRIATYNVDFDCPVGNVTINGSQTLRNKKPACCDGPIGIVLIIGRVCVGVETENKTSV